MIVKIYIQYLICNMLGFPIKFKHVDALTYKLQIVLFFFQRIVTDKGNSWSLSKGDRPIVSNDFNAPVNDSTKLTVHLRANECASRSFMHGRDD